MPLPNDSEVSARLLEEGGEMSDIDEEIRMLEGDTTNGTPPMLAARSHYSLTKREVAKGIANRFVHSRSYILLYLVMAGLSVATVVLSLQDGCPGSAFYILEFIVNGAMILEVGIRFVAFGRQFWKSPFNVVDLAMTMLCGLTLLVIIFAGCGATSKEEELLDTLLLVARNILQFGRLASVMRQSGQSIFSRPKAIDLTLPHRSGPGGGYGLDIDLSDDEDEDVRPLGGTRNNVAMFNDDVESRRAARLQQQRKAAAAVRPVDTGDQDDTWAALG